MAGVPFGSTPPFDDRGNGRSRCVSRASILGAVSFLNPELIEASGIPYTIIRATQFLEFLGGIADSSADGNIVRLPLCLFQPIVADNVAPIVAEAALAVPRNGIVEIAGPERPPFNEIVARYLKAVGDPREVVCDPEARYWAAASRSYRSCRWAKRASAASAWTNGSAAHRQKVNEIVITSACRTA